MLTMIMYIPLRSVQQSLCADTIVWPTCTNSSILQELPGREKNLEPPVQKKTTKQYLTYQSDFARSFIFTFCFNIYAKAQNDLL